MARSRLGVVLVVPPPIDAEVDGLRRACGDRSLGRIAPHVTLVPPVNVRDEQVGEVVEVVRRAAAAHRPVSAVLGPPATFLPLTPVVFLSVGELDVGGTLARLRDDLLAGPLDRPSEYAFVPHVTLAEGLADGRVEAALAALADYRAEVTFDRVTLLREDWGPSGRRWVPAADAALAPARVVGRGGLPLELDVGEELDPAAAAFAAREWPVVDRDQFGAGWRPRRPYSVAARREGEVVGVAAGWTFGGLAWLSELLVAAPVRGQGVGTHLLRTVEHLAAERGCRRMGLRAVAGEPAEQLYRRRGWEEEARMPGWWHGRDVVQLGRDVA